MQEDFLHYIWKLKKFDVKLLKSTDNEYVNIVSVGRHNLNAGPDFFNAQVKIRSQLWAGNVEIHVKSSDWYLHNHENDPTYDNVILHVVWEHDTDVFRRDNTVIPTLVLKPYVSNTALDNYNSLFSKSRKWINCENDFNSIDLFTIKNWLERLYFERLERKSLEVNQLLRVSENNWEAVLFKMLAKNFGSKVNGDSFLSLADSIDFSIIRKLQSNQTYLEALLFGQANILRGTIEDGYFVTLKREFEFLKQKFTINNNGIIPIQYFRLRPPNFPTIRLSQLANLYFSQQNMFSKIIEATTLDEFYEIFKVSTTEFWETHYTFDKVSKQSKKVLTKSFIDLILINTILPMKFSYAKSQGKEIEEGIVKLISEIKSEKNSIIDKFNTLKPISKSALESQGVIQLKNEYCDKNKCLQCVVGNSLLNRN